MLVIIAAPGGTMTKHVVAYTAFYSVYRHVAALTHYSIQLVWHLIYTFLMGLTILGAHDDGYWTKNWDDNYNNVYM